MDRILVCGRCKNCESIGQVLVLYYNFLGCWHFRIGGQPWVCILSTHRPTQPSGPERGLPMTKKLFSILSGSCCWPLKGRPLQPIHLVHRATVWPDALVWALGHKIAALDSLGFRFPERQKFVCCWVD